MNLLEVKVLHLTNIVFIIAIRIVFPLREVTKKTSPMTSSWELLSLQGLKFT